MKLNFFIFGLGQIGSSFSLALKRANISNSILGKDLKRRNYFKGLIDEYVEDWRRGIEKADVVIISTPVMEIIKLVREIAPLLSKDQILLDTGSTKKRILKEMQRYPERILIGGHPMAGSIRRGKDAIDENLFSGKPFFISFPHEYSRKGEEIIKYILRSIGGIPYEIDGELHDLFTSVVSHLPYVLSIALYSVFLDFYKKDKRIENFISSGFIGSTRLALTDSKVARDILITNSSNIVAQIERFISELRKLKKGIEKNDFYNFISEIKKVAEKRRKDYENFRS